MSSWILVTMLITFEAACWSFDILGPRPTQLAKQLSDNLRGVGCHGGALSVVLNSNLKYDTSVPKRSWSHQNHPVFATYYLDSQR